MCIHECVCLCRCRYKLEIKYMYSNKGSIHRIMIVLVDLFHRAIAFKIMRRNMINFLLLSSN